MADTISQKLLLEVETDTQKAQNDLAKLKNELGGLGGGSSPVASGFDKVSASADRSTKAIRNITAAVQAGKMPEEKAQARIQKRIKLLEALRKQQGLTGKQRAKLDSAILQSSSAASKFNTQVEAQTGVLSKMNNMNTKTIFSISNLAQTFQLASGPAHQMKFVLGQIFDQFTLMGPKGLLIGGAVAGLGMLWKSFNQGGKSAAELKKEMEDFTKQFDSDVKNLEKSLSVLPDVVKRLSKEFRVNLGGALEELNQAFSRHSLKDQLDAINAEIVEFGKSDAEKTAIRASAAFYEMNQALKQSEQDIQRLVPAVQQAHHDFERLKKLEEEQGLKVGDQVLLAKTKLDNLKKELATAAMVNKTGRENIEIERQRLREIKRAAKELDGLEARAERLAAQSKAKAKRLADEAKAAEKAKKDALKEAERDEEKSLKRASKIRISNIKKVTEEEKKAAATRKSLMMEGQTLANTLLQESIKLTFEGEKYLGDALLKMFLERTGQTLVALGTRAIFEGGLEVLGGNPAGTAKIGLGTAAIAAGVGMSAGAAQIIIPEAEKAKKGGKKKGKKSENSGGVSGGFGGTTSQGQSGPMIINISYGVGGPEPESAAQAVLDAIAIGNRRGLRGRA